MATPVLILDRIKLIKLPGMAQSDSEIFWPCIYYAKQSEYFQNYGVDCEFVADLKLKHAVLKQMTMDQLKRVTYHGPDSMCPEAPIAVLLGPPSPVTEKQRLIFEPNKSHVMGLQVSKVLPIMKMDQGRETVEHLMKLFDMTTDDETLIPIVDYEPESQTDDTKDEASSSESDEPQEDLEDSMHKTSSIETSSTELIDADDAESAREGKVISSPDDESVSSHDFESNLPKACDDASFMTPDAKDRRKVVKEADVMQEEAEVVTEGITRDTTAQTPDTKPKLVTPTTRGSSTYRFPSRGKARHAQFRDVKKSLTKLGCIFRENLYCRPGCDPELNPNADKDKDYFETEKEFRDDLCRFGIEDNESLNEDQKTLVHEWIRYAIIRSFDLSCKMPKVSEDLEFAGRSMQLLRRIGLKYSSNAVCNVYYFPGVNYKDPRAEGTFEFDKELKNYMARYGIPDSLRVHELTPEDHLNLELHLAEWLDEEFTFTFHGKPSTIEEEAEFNSPNHSVRKKRKASKYDYDSPPRTRSAKRVKDEY